LKIKRADIFILVNPVAAVSKEKCPGFDHPYVLQAEGKRESHDREGPKTHNGHRLHPGEIR
jgi:hypothetical protein